MQYKIFGERNTGTRALKALVEGNLGARVFPSTEQELAPERCPAIEKDEAAMDRLFAGLPAALAWKHCATHFDDVASLAETKVLITVKHPLAWLVSFFARPYHWRPASTLPEFAAQAWQTVARERLDERSFKPLDLYCAKLKSYFQLERKLDCTFIKAEDLVLRPEAVLRELGLTGPFRPLTRSTKDERRTVAGYVAYYGEERWRDQLEGLTEHPDWDQVARFGYR